MFRLSRAVLLTIIGLAIAPPAFADIPAGSLDPSWDGDGIATTSVGAGASRANAAALQPDGKVVVVGWAGGVFGVARYGTNGALDGTFDGDGRVTTDFPGSTEERAFAVALQDDKIVVAGRYVEGATRGFAVARYEANGSPDATFGTGGVVKVPMGDSECAPAGYWGTAAYGIAIQGSKIVLAGCAQEGLRTKFALARLNSNGSLDDDTMNDLDINDTPFGTAGRVMTDVTNADNKYAYAMALVLDGSEIVVGGFAFTDSDRLVLLRYSADGALTDTNIASAGAGDRIVALARQSDGKIVAAGPGGSPAHFAVARFLSNGDLDPGFGSGGVRETTFPQGEAWAGGVAIQPDGKIVVAGKVNGGTNANGFGVARYTTGGVLDTTFGSGGTAFHSSGAPAQAGFDQVGLLLQSDGKIVVAGPGDTGLPGGGRFATARLFPETILTDVDNDGDLDSADNCPNTPNSDQANQDGDPEGDACDPDDDNDGRQDSEDNCVQTFNPNLADLDGDGAGDECDADDDGDGVLDPTDNCPRVDNPNQRDTDGDNTGNVCDSSPGHGESSVTINNEAPFTNNPNVTLTIDPTDDATGVILSNDGGFGNAETFPLEADQTYPWTLDATRQDVPRTVYVRFSGPGQESIPLTDEIVLDSLKPKISLVKRNKRGDRLTVKARDRKDGTGVEFMQVTRNRERPGRLRPFAKTVAISPGGRPVFVRVIDKAENRSRWRRERRGNR